MLFYSFYNNFGKRNWLRNILKVSICMLTFNHQPCDHEIISLVFGIHRQALPTIHKKYHIGCATTKYFG